jgi:hypothetical protein
MPRTPCALEVLLVQLRAGERELDDNLPTFGGPAPRDTSGVWSWDATHLLVGTCAQDLELAPRIEPESEQWGTDGHWIARTRERLGLTQAALAAATGLAPNTVARIERDELPLTRSRRRAIVTAGLTHLLLTEPSAGEAVAALARLVLPPELRLSTRQHDP